MLSSQPHRNVRYNCSTILETSVSEGYRFIIGDQSPLESSKTLDLLNNRSKHDLFAALAVRAENASSGAAALPLEADGVTILRVPDIKTIFDPGSFTQGPKQVELGRRIFNRWLSELRNLLCGAGQDEEQLQQNILRALTGREGGATAVIAVLIAKQFNLEASQAALIAALSVRLVAKPAMDEICRAWSQALEERN
jgi:hypothetical protein